MNNKLLGVPLSTTCPPGVKESDTRIILKGEDRSSVTITTSLSSRPIILAVTVPDIPIHTQLFGPFDSRGGVEGPYHVCIFPPFEDL